jgi:hypothetical protein
MLDLTEARRLCEQRATHERGCHTFAPDWLALTYAMAATLPAAIDEIEKLRRDERRRQELLECCTCKQAAADAQEDNIRLGVTVEKLRAALEEACAIAENDHKFMRLDARPLDADEAILLSLYEQRIAALRRLVQP